MSAAGHGAGSIAAKTTQIRHRNIRLRSAIPGASRVIWRGPSAPALALTFDDGPEPEGTNAIAEALAHNGSSGTFFVLVDKARRTPSLLKDLAEAGHEVSLHSDRHERLDRIPVRALSDRLAGARHELEDLLGSTVRYLRPPFGRTSWRTLLAARRAGLEVVLWSHAPRDWAPMQPALLDASIRQCLVPGAIVVLHDGSQRLPDQGQTTAASLRRVLAEAGSEISPVTLSRLLGHTPG